MEEVNMDTVNMYSDKMIDLVLLYGPKLIGAIVVWIIGSWVIKLLTKGFTKMLEKSKTDASLKPFLTGIITALLKVMLVISVLGMLGIEMTSFIAILGAAGLAVGMALSGTLQNFAGGVMILIFKPYKIGDLITAQGHTGVVKEIQIFVTTLLTPENKTVFIPNGPLANNDVTNFTVEGLIRVDLTFGIDYSASIKDAKNVLIKVMQDDPNVLKDPAPFVGVSELGDSSVNLAVRPHCKPEHYWDVYFNIYENGKEALDLAKISIPFPQMDLHVKKDL
jgi:small conductance mechanosensitive channel